jgi:hypothetical protein
MGYCDEELGFPPCEPGEIFAGPRDREALGEAFLRGMNHPTQTSGTDMEQARYARPKVTERNPMTTELSPADPAVCIAEAAKEAIDMAVTADQQGRHIERDHQLLRAIQQITYLRGH